MTDDGLLKLNGKEKYRDGVDNFTYNSDGTWIENSVYISGGTVITRTKLDNGKVEIIDDTIAKLWQETKSLSQIPGASELIYDNKTDNISVGGTNNTYSRAKYK